MNIKLIVSVGLALFGLADPASATIYNVNLGSGAVSISGSITTDSLTGVLHGSDITDWNLLINTGAASFNLIKSDASDTVFTSAGNALTATASGLFFDFSG